MRKLSPFFFIFFVLIVSVIGSSGKAAAISDDFEYYGTASISDDWVVTKNDVGGELILAPVLDDRYPTTQLRMYAYISNENIVMKNTTYPGYFSCIVRFAGVSGGLYSRVHVLNAAGAEVVYFDIATAGNNVNNAKIEIILNGGYFDYYRDGVLIESKSSGGTTYSTPVKYKITSSARDGYLTGSDLVIDDLTTGSIVGTSPLYVESTSTIPFTWSAQLMRSYPDSVFNVTLYSITNTTNAGKLYTWNLNSQYASTGKEFGNFTFNRSSMLGLNYGLYLLEMTKDDGALYDCYFYYDNVADPAGYPETLLMATSTVSMDIRDSANNGGTISPDGYTYLYATNGTDGYYPISCALKNTPYSFTTEINAVYGADKIKATPVTFTSLTNSYSVALDGVALTGAQADGVLDITGNFTDEETITIGGDVYEFNSTGSTGDGNIEVSVGNNLTQSVSNLVHAINSSGSEPVTAVGESRVNELEYSSAPIIITNNPGITRYQAQMNLVHQTGMNANFSNIRFYDGPAEIPYWIQDKVDSTNATVWIPINASSNITCRWGYSNETESESNISAVMEMGDEFGAFNSSTWTQIGVTVTDGVAIISATNADSQLVSTQTWGTNYTYMVRAKTQHSGVYSSSYERPAGFATGSYETFFGVTVSSGTAPELDNIYGGSSIIPVPVTWTPGTYYTVNVTRTPTQSIVKVAGVTSTLSSNVYTGNMNARSRAISQSGGVTSVIYIDWACVRKYTAVDPTLTMGESTIGNSASGNVTVTAENTGSEYNSISTAETCQNASWSKSTLSGGLDGGQVTGSTWSYTITDWTNYTAHIITFTPDLTKAGVFGYVKDLSTSQGIHGAIVTISNDTFSTNVQTDEQGYYYLTQGMKAGETYSIKAQKSGYTESTAYSVTTKESASSRKDLYLESTTDGSGIYYQSHDVTFTVLEYWYSSVGLPGVSYEVYNGNTSVKNGSTGSKGTFTVTKMDAGTNYTFILTYNGTTYTEYLEPGLTDYNLVLNKEGIVHQYYNSWLNLTYAETSDNVTILYASNKTVSTASLTVTASNGTVVYSEVYNTSSGSFLFPSTEGDYNLQFNIEASDGSTASQAWSISSPPEVTLFPDSYPTWLKNTLFVAIIIIFLLAFGKSKNDIACGAAAVLTSFGYYFKWLTCSFNFVVLIWIIALAAIYLHYKRTGHVG